MFSQFPAFFYSMIYNFQFSILSSLRDFGVPFSTMVFSFNNHSGHSLLHNVPLQHPLSEREDLKPRPIRTALHQTILDTPTPSRQRAVEHNRFQFSTFLAFFYNLFTRSGFLIFPRTPTVWRVVEQKLFQSTSSVPLELNHKRDACGTLPFVAISDFRVPLNGTVLTTETQRHRDFFPFKPTAQSLFLNLDHSHSETLECR